MPVPTPHVAAVVVGAIGVAAGWQLADPVVGLLITVAVRHRLLHDIRRLGQAIIHSSPCGHDGRDHHATTAHHFAPGAPAR